MELLSDVFSDYKKLTKHNDNKIDLKYFNENYKSTNSIFNLIPNKIEEILQKRLNEFIIKPSIGQGIVTDIPWVCILNKEITNTPQVGYYIALLFSYDMNECYLSLNQAATEAKKVCGDTKTAIEFLRKTAKGTTPYLTYDKNAICGPIDLKARRYPGTGYEKASIQSFRYKKGALPSMEEFRDNLLVLLSSYDNLIRLFSKSLSSASEELFDTYVLGLASLEEKSKEENKTENKKAKDKILGNSNLYPRDARTSSLAIKNANFLCEFEPNHEYFTSKTSNNNYVEAHHLIPLSHQDKFEYSLDVEENIISLCPNCHKKLHHGLDRDKAPILSKLFQERTHLLKERKIEISFNDLIAMYD
ncbi:DUF3578 domain-containing protein [Dickeya fangzhongdai]|uniref:MrcB family domain-containing protein n=1 Tax=Dickeya fangzhongdai TaxID=1778540 RepID=UPI00137074CE|nr:DUF3578 domain-containing protein [Dickeya fangzhongdai]UMB78847.1 DUF3578 domain-containing protein [Dickeya fangzhongdai]